MEDIERLALAGLLHDLPILFKHCLPDQQIPDWVQEPSVQSGYETMIRLLEEQPGLSG